MLVSFALRNAKPSTQREWFCVTVEYRLKFSKIVDPDLDILAIVHWAGITFNRYV